MKGYDTMYYLVTNPACPYCYGNDRIIERELPNLNDNDIMLLPYTLTADIQEFDNKLYETYKNSFINETIPYLKTLNITLPSFYKKENISPSRLVFITYYYLREKNLGLKFYHEITKRFFQTDFNYGNIDEIAAIVSELGLNKEVYLAALNNPLYEQQYLDNLQQIDELDIESVPAYIIDNEILLGIFKGIAKIKEQQ